MGLSGPEMLLKNLLGIDPKQMAETLTGVIKQVNEIHLFMQEIRGRLDRLEKHLGVMPDENLALPNPENERSAANG